MKKLMISCGFLLVFFCVQASPVHAVGLGVYGNFDGGKMIWDGEGTRFTNYGGGLVLDTNLAGDSIFNYRLEFGFSNLRSSYQAEEYDLVSVLILGIPLTKKTTRWENSLLVSTVHYFGFGVVRSNYVRFWLGPQLSLGGMVTNLKGLYAGLGFAMGLNFNIGSVVTLSLTASGRFLGGGRFYTYNGVTYSSGGYGGDGMTTLAFIFRFPVDTNAR